MNSVTDDELYRRYRSGNRRAFDELYERFRQPLYNYVRRSVSADRVDELYQDIWLKVIATSARYQNNGRFRQWVFTCAHHLIVDEYRRSSRGEEVPLPELAAPTKADDEFKSKIDQAILRLPMEQRQAFYLRHELDCSVAEIAEIQGCATEAAKSRLRYAYAKLKDQLKAELKSQSKDNTE